ncbi:MAG: hypothetical protein JNL07_08915 [Rhodospirillales bacterium]|nr:hypothetical protein [Rhodospirillales bacterium]
MLARMSGAGGARASADSARARLLYHCAAEQGIAVAMHELADHYLSGDGSDGALTDVAAARQWYFRAFEAGYEHAAGPAGAMAAAGRGGPRDEAAAVAVLQQMIELKIFDAADLRNLAAALAEHPETGRGALEVARAAVEEAGKRRDAYLWVPALAWIHFRLGDGAKAEAMLRAGLARFGGADNMDLRRTLGDVLHGLGRIAEARAEWQRALRGIEGTLGGLPLQRRLDLTK